MTHNTLKYRNKSIAVSALYAVIVTLVSPSLCLSAPEAADPKTPEKTAEKTDKTVPSAGFGDYLSGRFAESSGDSDKSIKFLRESMTRNPGNPEIAVNLYNALITAGKIEDAIPVAKKLYSAKLPDDGNEFPPVLLLALESAKNKRYEEAEKYLHSVSKTGFNSVLLPLLQAWFEAGKGTVKAPVDAKNILPNSKLLLSHIYLNAAFINELSGFENEAAGQYEIAAQETRLGSLRAAEALANYDLRKGKRDKFSQFAEQYAKTYGETIIDSMKPDDHVPKPLVGNVTEGLAEALYTVAGMFHGVRAPADEITTLTMALYLRKDFPAAEFLLANAYELKHSYKDAINAYKTIPAESPYFTQGQIMTAYNEGETGNKDSAIAKLDKIAEEKPGSVSALLAKGDILRTSNDFQHAIESYDTAITRIKLPLKSHWIIYFSRGICYDHTGRFEKTEEDMKKALQISPGEPDVLNYLGYSWLIKNRNISEAKKMIGEAYDARPEDAQVIDSMGYALYIEGDFASAQEYFEQALERIPNDPTVNEHLGDVYWQLGRKTEAGYQWQRALDNKPDEENKKTLLKKLAGGIASISPTGADDKKPSRSQVQ